MLKIHHRPRRRLLHRFIEGTHQLDAGPLLGLKGVPVAVLPALEIRFCFPYETSLAGWHRRHSDLVKPGSDKSKRESPNQNGSSAQKRRIPPQGLLPLHGSAYIEAAGSRFSVLTGPSLPPPRLALWF